MGVDRIKELLGSDPAMVRWLEHLEAIGAPDFDVVLPPAAELAPVLLDLAVPHEDIDALVAMLPALERSPELWWLLERSAYALVRQMGTVGWPPMFPTLPASLGAIGRYFFVYVFLAVLPHVRAFHRTRGILDDVGRRTLADLGRNMAVHRRRHGDGGLSVPFWLMLHFRGAIYDLGRLQFERARLGNRTGRAIAEAGMPYGPGDPVLGVHIPAFYGPLSPQACDTSFARAREFFARHFPEETYRIATCHSWLLDPGLAEYLPEDANIIRFQRRFQLAHRPEEPDDESILRFVFGRTGPTLDDLPQRTLLERAVVAHLKAGGHWHGGAGWLEM